MSLSFHTNVKHAVEKRRVVKGKQPTDGIRVATLITKFDNVPSLTPRMDTTIIDNPKVHPALDNQTHVKLPVIKVGQKSPKSPRKKAQQQKPLNSSKHEKVTKCDLCSNRFNDPKCLPCLHTFCKTCLSKYICSCTKDAKDMGKTSFPCPTCKSATTPEDVDKDPADWAEQFPTDTFVLSLIEILSFENQEKLCGPCERKEKKGVRAHLWCRYCKVCLCKSCLDFHNAMFPDHAPLSISKVTREPTLISGYQDILCPVHKHNLDLFCEDHQHLGCPTCIAVQHRQCKNVLTVKDGAHNLKLNGDPSKILQQYDDCLESVGHVIQDGTSQIEYFGKRKENITSKVKRIREEIDKHLDQIQERFLAKINSIHEEETDNIGEQIKECRSLQTAIKESRRMVKATSSYGSDAQLISTLLKAKSNYEDYRRRTTEISENSEDLDLDFQLNQHLQDLTSTVSTFATLEVVREIRPLPKSVSKLRRMFNRRSQEVHQFYVRLPSDNVDCVITSGLYLPDGKLILCDFQNRNVKMFRETGLFVNKLLLPSEPFGICRVNDMTIAVTQPNNREVTLITIKDDVLQISNSVNIGRVCYGIERLEDKFVILFPMGKPSPHMSSISIEDIQNRDSSNDIMFDHRPFHIAVNNLSNEIIVTQKTSTPGDKQGLVFSSDLQRKNDIHHPDLRWARGVDIDQDGNIYVCGQTTSNVSQFTPDGVQSRVILSAADGIKSPAAISFCADKFFLTDVSEEYRNILKIYEMQ